MENQEKLVVDKDKIKDFILVNSSKHKNELSSEEDLTIQEQLPDSALWTYNEEHYSLQNNQKLITHLLKNQTHIAVVEAPFDIKHNKAYIINGEKKIIWNISALFDEKYKAFLYNKRAYFSDVCFIKNELYFFVVIDNLDFRFYFDRVTGAIGKLIESR